MDFHSSLPSSVLFLLSKLYTALIIRRSCFSKLAWSLLIFTYLIVSSSPGAQKTPSMTAGKQHIIAGNWFVIFLENLVKLWAIRDCLRFPDFLLRAIGSFSFLNNNSLPWIYAPVFQRCLSKIGRWIVTQLSH